MITRFSGTPGRIHLPAAAMTAIRISAVIPPSTSASAIACPISCSTGYVLRARWYVRAWLMPRFATRVSADGATNASAYRPRPCGPSVRARITPAMSERPKTTIRLASVMVPDRTSGVWRAGSSVIDSARLAA